MKRKISIVFSCVLFIFITNITAQDGSVSISETVTDAHESSILDISSTTKGVLIPRMNSVQRNSISNPADGLLVFDTDEKCFYFYNESDAEWNSLCESGSLDGGWLLLGNSDTDSEVNFIGTVDEQPIVFRTNDSQRMVIFENGQIAVNNDLPFEGVVFNSFAGGDNDAIAAAAVDGNAIYGQSEGEGDAILGFSDGEGVGVVGINAADGEAILGIAAGEGVGIMGINNASGTGMVAANTGTGRAFEAVNLDEESTETTAIVFQDGLGRAAGFQTELATNDQQTLFSAQNSTLDASSAASVWGQSNSTRSGVFLTNKQSDNSIALNAQYIGGGQFDGLAVLGLSVPEDGYGVGVHGEGGFVGTAGIGDDIGVLGITNDEILGWGLYAEGDIGASGVKLFVIDHPFDPENKILKHAAIESNEILNHYRGNIELDNDGKATIELPHYFEGN